MTYKITKEKTQEHLAKALASTIGQTKDNSGMSKIIKSTLESLKEKGLLHSFEVEKVQTLHDSKNVYDKFLDWIKWYSPLKKFFYKPYYQQVYLSELLYIYREHGASFDDYSEDEFEDLISKVEGIKVWEQRYPENPYNIMRIKTNIIPTKPLNYVQIDFEIEDTKLK